MEAKIIAANEGAKEAAWLEKITNDLYKTPQILILQCNNLGGIDLIKDPKHYNKAKHIEIRYLYI